MTRPRSSAEVLDRSSAEPIPPATGPRIWIAGAAPDTANLGVSALCDATIDGLAERLPGARLTVLDHGRGLRRRALRLGAGVLEIDCRGAVHSRRLHRPESLRTMRALGAVGCGSLHPHLRELRRADAFLDLSGGDSFSDIYGRRRFAAITLPKRIALAAGVPLVLMPQTYGPFASRRAERIAASLVRRASLAWARDARSFAVLRALLGDRFDPTRHRATVDVAFLLRPIVPEVALPSPLARWLDDDRATPTVGINVSGLIHNDPVRAARDFGFKASYRDVVRAFVARLLAESRAKVLLVPHVVVPVGHYESDLQACESVVREFGGPGERLAIAPVLTRPGEAKWLISRCEWFCGTRMHATIAALSSGVPTAAIAYSPKTQGVFESCDQGGEVFDPRVADDTSVVAGLWSSWNRRDACRTRLRARLPEVLGAAAAAMDELAAFVRARGSAAAARRLGRGQRG